jgi:Fe2+ transport system protein B
MDLSILPSTRIEAEMNSPSCDPTAYWVRGALVALRKEQANLIRIQKVLPESPSITYQANASGWTLLTAVNLMLFSLIHNPCSTTLYAMYKETGSKSPAKRKKFRGIIQIR